MSNRVVSLTFRHIIDEEIANVRQDFEDMGIEKEVLEELQRSWEAKLVATQVTEFDGTAGVHGMPAYGTGVAVQQRVEHADRAEGKQPDMKKEEDVVPGSKRKREADDDAGKDDEKKADDKDDGKDEIGSDLDDSDDEDAEGTEDMILCLYDKVRASWMGSVGACDEQCLCALARGVDAAVPLVGACTDAGTTRQEQVEVRLARWCCIYRRTRLPFQQVQRVRVRRTVDLPTDPANSNGDVTCAQPGLLAWTRTSYSPTPRLYKVDTIMSADRSRVATLVQRVVSYDNGVYISACGRGQLLTQHAQWCSGRPSCTLSSGGCARCGPRACNAWSKAPTPRLPRFVCRGNC